MKSSSTSQEQHRSGLLNTTILSSAFGSGAYYLIPGSGSPDWYSLPSLGLGFISIYYGIKAFSIGWRYTREFYRYVKAISEGTSHGDAGFLTEAEAKLAGLHKRRPGSHFVGVLGKSALWLHTETHTLIIGPAGSSKSSAAFMPRLALDPGSCIIVDIKREFWETTSELRRKKFKHRIVVLDPTSEDTGYLNPLDYIHAFLKENSPAVLTLVRGWVLQSYPEPPEEGANKFFRDGTRLVLVAITMAVVATCPAEHRNLATVYRALTNETFLNELLMRAGQCTLLNGEIAQMAEDLHRMAFGDDGAAKTYEQFRVGAMQAMEAYGPGNYLAKITSKSTFDFADLKQEKITVYITVDFANKDVLGKWAGAMLWLATDQLVRANNNVPVTIYHDENCNSPLYILPTLLTLLRSYGVKYIGATQDLEDISRVYGKPALATLLSETDVKQFLAPIRSQTTLDYLSKSLGEYTAMAESFSFTEEGVKESSSRRAQALQTAEQIRRLPKDAQIIFYSNFRPILARKVQVFAMAPLRKQIAPNSMYGGKRYLKPVEVVIRRTGARVTEKGKFMLSRSRKWPLIAEYLIARSPVKRILAGTALITLMFVLGTPHLRWEYRFTGHHTNSGTLFDCQYVGLERFTLDGPNCPVVVFRKIKLPDF